MSHENEDPPVSGQPMTKPQESSEGNEQAHSPHHEPEHHGHEHGGHEHHGHDGHGHHKPRIFKIQIDKVHYELHDANPTGAHLLTLAGKLPVENFAIYQRMKEGQPHRIGLHDHVDLTKPGTERFVTLPLDQTEG
jgi:hypothetical protein